MTTYKGIRGLTIRTVAGDPSPLIAGDIWYSSTTKKIRGAKVATGAWSSGGAMNTARRGVSIGGAGTRDAALCISGDSPKKPEVESYDGSSWTEVADVNTARAQGGAAGLSTAALIISGNTPPVSTVVESYDGSSWTEIADVNTARTETQGAGIQTAALLVGGMTAPKGQAEKWNGTSWTEVGDLNTARASGTSAGTSTAALSVGGYGGPPYTSLGVVEEWNGTSWTEVGDISTVRAGHAGGGTTTSAMAFQGSPHPIVNTEQFDGSSWTEVANAASGSQLNGAAVANTAAGLTFAGYDGTNNLTTTQEWDESPVASSFTSS